MHTLELKYFPYDSVKLPVELRFTKDPNVRLIMQVRSLCFVGAVLYQHVHLHVCIL